MFTPDELAQDIQRQLNQGHISIPEGHSQALIIHGDTETKEVTATVARKLGEHWQVQGIFSWGVDRGVKSGFNLEWSK